MADFYYSSTAAPNSLASGIDGSVTTLTLASSPTGYPSSYPFKVVLDPNTASEEIVYVTNLVGTAATVTRGREGTAGVAHTSGAVFQHMITGDDLQRSRDHEAATAAHGATGAVVGTTNAQALSNKTINSVDNTLTISGAQATLSNIPQSAVTSLVTDLANRLNKATELGTGWLATLGAALGSNWATALASALGSGWTTVLNAALGSGWSTAFASALGSGWASALSESMGSFVDFHQEASGGNVSLNTTYADVNPVVSYTPPAGWNTYKMHAFGYQTVVPASSGVNIETRLAIGGTTGTSLPNNPNTGGGIGHMAIHEHNNLTGAQTVKMQAKTSSSTAEAVAGWIYIIAVRTS